MEKTLEQLALDLMGKSDFINEEDLFYLMSRGISYNDSVKLIIKGMILSNINPDMENMERILSILDSIGGE